jgi:ParB/RepB/Spo0J family partition protein
VAKKLVIEYVKADLLKENPKNPRRNDEVVDKIKGSMDKFGWTNPILVRRADNTVIAGHTRLKAARKAGVDTVPVVYLDLNEQDADAYMLADNKLGELATWDEAGLAAIIGELQVAGVDVAALGFSPKNVEQLFAEEKEKSNGEVYNIPEYFTVIVTPEQRAEIELKLDDEEGENRTEQLLCLIRRT